MIIVVDYGVGNLSSAVNMLKKLRLKAAISSDPTVILKASRIVLPGVGHFDYAMKMLNRSGLRDALEQAVFRNACPILGICLGAQILGKASEEGNEKGLGWIDMVCKRLPDGSGIRVPHMGWNQVSVRKQSPLLDLAAKEARYYFAHSYYMDCTDPSDIVGTTSHGIEFASVVRSGRIYGAQFHPEKSLRHGFAVLQAFAELRA